MYSNAGDEEGYLEDLPGEEHFSPRSSFSPLLPIQPARQTLAMLSIRLVPDEGHGIRKLLNRIIAYRRIAAFLERTLDISN
jgi:hypothetical protein